MIARTMSGTISNGDVIGLTAAGIGLLWLVGGQRKANVVKDGGNDDVNPVFEQRLLRNPKHALHEIFDISKQSVAYNKITP